MIYQSYDVAVIGASFSGLAFAQTSSTLGLKTVVIERKPSSGYIPHTTGIIVKELADELDIPRQLTKKIKKVRLYAPSLEHVDLVCPDYYFLATDTAKVLDWMADQTKHCGSKIIYNQDFKRASYSHNELEIKTSSNAIRCRYLIGADGPRSSVAQAFRLGTNKYFLKGTEHEFVGIKNLEEDCLHVFLDSELASGYIAWAVPGVNCTQIGLATHADSELNVNKLINKLSRIFDFSQAELVSKRGGVIPIGGLVQPLHSDKVLLIGDAAGVVSPVTAGGIHNGFRCGKFAARAVADFLLDSGREPFSQLSSVYPSFFWKNMLRRIFDLNPPNALYNVLISNLLFKSFSQMVFFHHRGIFSPKAWQELVQYSLTTE